MAATPQTKSFASSFAAGSVSGACSTVLFQPLDLVKTRLQVNSLNHALATPADGTFRTMVNVARNENFLALWKGLTPSLTRTVPGVGVYFGVLHGMRQVAMGGDTAPTPAMAGVFAACSRTIASFALLPFTVIKTRFESGAYHYRGVGHALRSMRKREGFRSLYSGLWATLMRDVPSSSLYYMFYTASKEHVKTMVSDEENLKYANLACAIESSLLACLITHPADVVKTRLQIDKTHHLGTVETARRLLKSEGRMVFFQGAQARVLRRSCVIALSWTVYENIVDFFAKAL